MVDGDWRVLDIVREHDFEVPQLEDSLTLARDPEVKQQIAEFEKANPDVSWEELQKGVGQVFRRVHEAMAKQHVDEIASLLTPFAREEIGTRIECGRPLESGEPAIEEVAVLRLVADALDEFGHKLFGHYRLNIFILRFMRPVSHPTAFLPVQTGGTNNVETRGLGHFNH